MKIRILPLSTYRGFTIIELLVVVAIIGLLASIVIASLSSTRMNARDARRISDIATLQKALALYATNQEPFPIETTPIVITTGGAVGATLITDRAIDTVPIDPLAPTYQYEYVSDATGSTYELRFCLETNTIKGYSQGCGNTATP